MAEEEEIIIFVNGSTFHVNLKVDEKGKYFRDAKTNIAWTKYSVGIILLLLCNKICEEKECNFCYFFKGKFDSYSVNAK